MPGLFKKRMYGVGHLGHSPLVLVFSGLLLIQATSASLRGQPTQATNSCESTLQAQYDTAERLQASGNRHEAAFDFGLFIAQALHCIAMDRSEVGQYAKALSLFEKALQFSPNDDALRLDFASAAIAARDFPRAKDLATSAPGFTLTKCQGPPCARAHLLLGEALTGVGDISGAREEFEVAVRLEPTFQHGYALAKSYLALADKKAAAAIFAEMLSSYGDSAGIHMDFGRAYGEADFPEEAIREFNQTLAKDSGFPEAHYCLGASYLMRSGDTDFMHAEAEFRKEISLHPDDSFSYSQLGYIAMNRHNLQEAEADLSRAATLNPRNPDNFLLLGQIYADTKRPTEAETALRSAIAVTTDPSRNHYQIRGAHYQLGRLLMQRGQTEEAKREMQITQDLLLQNRMLDQVNLTGKPLAGYQFPMASATAAVDPKARAAAEEFERQIAPAIADAYNNLGANAANDKDYGQAVGYFEQSAAWNPSTPGLDYNWGKAAYAAKQYRQAALCLGRFLKEHPESVALREPLGISAYLTGDYAAAVAALSPVADQSTATPLVRYAYAESLIRTGNYGPGVEHLQALQTSNPESTIFSLALGRAFASRGKYADAEAEIRRARQLRPADAEATYQLAVVLFAQKKDAEAQALLTGLAFPAGLNRPEDAELHHLIGELQLSHGLAKSAIANLEAAMALSPANSSISQDLAAAYRRENRQQDAEREVSRYKALPARQAADQGASVPTK